ncbi:MAG: acyltransferase family protein [Duncaniella sp.]|nr:acyltransferase family protein [Duncaniella sp.]
MTTQGRITYLDTARGLAIFTVLYSHVCIFCLPDYNASAILGFLRNYYLNAFFFVAGFFALRSHIPSVREAAGQMWRKTMQLLLPTVIVGSIYTLTHGSYMDDFIYAPAKNGYWFTLVLYEMFLLYYAPEAVATMCGCRHLVMLGLVVIVSCGLYVVQNVRPFSGPAADILCLTNLAYAFIYFVAGLVARQYRAEISRVVDARNGILITAIVCFVIAGYIVSLPKTLHQAAILVAVVYVLRRLSTSSRLEGAVRPVINLFTWLGSYTLEIYFIHYFLLFRLPDPLARFITTSLNADLSLSFPEFLTIGALVVVLSYFSVLIACFIKQIPYSSLLAFGKTAASARPSASPE